MSEGEVPTGVRISQDGFVGAIAAMVVLTALTSITTLVLRLRRRTSHKLFSTYYILPLMSMIYLLVAAILAFTLPFKIYTYLRATHSISPMGATPVEAGTATPISNGGDDQDDVEEFDLDKRNAFAIFGPALAGTPLVATSYSLQLAAAFAWAGIYLAKHAFVHTFTPGRALQMPPTPAANSNFPSISAYPYGSSAAAKFPRFWHIALHIILAASLVTSVPLSLMVCADFQESSIRGSCSIESINDKAKMYLYATSVLSIITTLLTLSAPIVSKAKHASLTTPAKVGLGAIATAGLGATLSAILRSAISQRMDTPGIDLPTVAVLLAFEAFMTTLLLTLATISWLFPDYAYNTFTNLADESRGRARDIELADSRSGSRASDRSESRLGVLKVETVEIHEDRLEDGDSGPPTPNRVSIRKDKKGERVSKLTDEEWSKLVKGERLDVEKKVRRNTQGRYVVC